LPVLAGTGSALEPTDDPRPLYEAAGRQLIERLGEDSTVAAQLEVLIVHLGNRVDRLISMLGDLIAKRDQWLHPVVRARASDALREELEQTLKRLVERHLTLLCESLGEQRRADIFELLQYAAGNLLGSGAIAAERRVLLETCLARTVPPDTDSASLQVWRAVAGMLFKQDGDLYESVNVRHGFPTTDRAMKSRMLTLLHSIAEDERLLEDLAALRTLPDPFYSDDQWRTLEALLELLPAAVAELQLVFQSQGKADYVEVALRALRALGPPDDPTDLALAFDYRLQHILVDEFQDTSFSQLDLLERLTAGWTDGDGRTLFCVGDPMQSIYRFRQAEVGLFIGLQQQGLRSLRLEPLRLQANFRSVPCVVEWVNEVFPGVLARRNDAEQGAVKYSPSTAAVAVEGEGRVEVHPFVNADAEAEAALVVTLVRDALRNVDGRIAVLVTARTHVDAIARLLTLAGIEFQAVDIEPLGERPVVQDLVALTRALVHLGDRTAWLAVLRAPWCGLTLSDLHAIAAQQAGTVEEAIGAALNVVADDLFAANAISPDGRTRLQRTYPLLQAALAERGRWPLRIWVERAWNALGGPATVRREEDLADAETFLDRLEQIETVADLEDVARLEEQLHRLFASARSEGRARVEVMTIHAAKGLEFDTVIVPGLHRQMPTEDRELLRWTRIAGEHGGMVLAPIKAEGSDADAIYRWIELLERRRVMRERARLLYVAVTRAKRELHLLGNVRASMRDGEITIHEPQKSSMLHMLWSAISPRWDDVAPSAAAAGGFAAPAPLKLRRLPLDWLPPQPAETARVEPTTLVDVTTERPVFDWVTLTSRHVGTLVHRELERLCRAREAPLDPASFRQRLMVELAELGVPPGHCAAACERVVAAMERTLADPRGRWLLGLDGMVELAELELAVSGVVAGQILEGIIDRTFIDENGARWIVDFKTSTHEGGGLDTFLDEEVVRYRDQLQRYATLLRLLHPGQTVRSALYFPMLRQWREVGV
jgi:ATP-dependent exoDNAse (exonuclease V) beta subunit